MGRPRSVSDDDDAPGKCSTCIYYTFKICTCIFSHVMLVTMVVLYCMAGAWTFQALETNYEINVKANISKIRSNLTRDLWGLTQDSPVLHEVNWTDAVKLRLKVFEIDLLRSMKSEGWDGNEDPKLSQWSFSGSLFYSIIVITTIGYGHIAPKTPWGKIVTIFYAILGIPLMLLCLSNVGDIMAQSFRFLYWRVCCFACTRKPKRPPPQFRRGRSVRSAPRQPGGGSGSGGGPNRNSWRSHTTSSFRRSARTSQRSADSALGLSDAMTRSTYSDAECRYADDVGVGEVTRGGVGRFSQLSRHSDSALAPHSPLGGGGDLPLDLDPRGAPVLFNKYALDMESAPALSRKSAPKLLDIPPPPPMPSQGDLGSQEVGRSNSMRRLPTRGSVPPQGQGRECRARIMSPMGFAISRQGTGRASRGSSRMSRLREDDYYAGGDYDVMMDYDYDDSSSGQRSKAKQVPIWLCVFLVVAYIIGGAFFFSDWEGWNLLDSAYFCFITLTTIGFGDFVPKQQRNNEFETQLTIFYCSLYLLFGIALLAMSFNLVQEEVIKNVKSVAKRLGILKDDEEDDD